MRIAMILRVVVLWQNFEPPFAPNVLLIGR
jgi:hypothetical protein